MINVDNLQEPAKIPISQPVNVKVPTLNLGGVILEDEVSGEISGLTNRVQNLGVTPEFNQTVTNLPEGFQSVPSSNTHITE